MDSTIELSDSSADKTIVLDDSEDKNKTIDLDSSVEETEKTSDHFVTAACTSKFLDNSPPKVTSTPNIPQKNLTAASTSLFQDVEDEFMHDDSFAEAEEATKRSLHADDDQDSAIESEKTPVESKAQPHSESGDNDGGNSSEESSDEDDTSGNDDDNLESDDEEEEESVAVCSTSISNRRGVNWEKLELPETCTKLTTTKGARVFVVGTAHFSRESQEDVVKVMRAVRPDVVVLELCKSRTDILQMDEETILSESKKLNTQKMMQTIREYGAVQGVMYILMLSMSANLTETLGMAPGGEFRVAFKESHKVPGCIVHLGDRPIHITLKRALASLTTWQKIKLAFNVLTSRDEITKEDVERCKQKDLLESMLEEMAGEYPSMSRVFVDERDTFLAYSLQQAAEAPFQNGSGLNDPPVVVGVVGIGHVNGIAQKFGKVHSRDVAQVIQLPVRSQSSIYVKSAIKGILWGLTAYGLYKVFMRNGPPRFFPPRLLTK